VKKSAWWRPSGIAVRVAVLSLLVTSAALAGTYSLVFFGAMRISQFKREPRGIDSQPVWGP